MHLGAVSARSRRSFHARRVFRQRHADRKTLRLNIVSVHRQLGAGEGGFEYTLIRSAEDLPPTAYGGKGGVVCNAVPPALDVWSMAKDP